MAGNGMRGLNEALKALSLSAQSCRAASQAWQLAQQLEYFLEERVYES
jgi:hypothetical protein